MKHKYAITLIYCAQKCIEVEAESLEEAKKLAVAQQTDHFRNAKAICKNLFIQRGQKMKRIA